MRIALDATPLVGAGTGVATCVRELHDGLHEHDDVEVVPFTLSARAFVRRRAVGRAVPASADALHRLWLRADRPRLDALLRGCDVVHGTNFVAPPTRRARIATIHDVSFRHYPMDAPDVVRRFDDLIQRQVSAGAVLHCSTEFIAGEVREIYGAERVEIVGFGGPEPLDPETWVLSRGAPSPDRPILVLGSTMHRKNVAWFVGVFERVAHEHPDAQLWIVGPPGPAEDEVVDAIESLDSTAGSRVRRLGRVSDEQRTTLLCRAAALAVPSRYEGFGLTMLEAMAHRLPVVASDVAALPEVAGDAAQLVGLDDVDGWVEALLGVLDGADAEAQRARGLDRVEALSWRRSVGGHVEMYRRCIEQRSES